MTYTYQKYGPKWEKEMSRFTKKELIGLLKYAWLKIYAIEKNAKKERSK